MIALAALAIRSTALAKDDSPVIRTANVGDGVELHYVERGAGVPVVFVHGSLADGSYWSDQQGAFGDGYRTIAYSRRYSFPNTNKPRPGYSAAADADDLAAFIKTLRLGQVHVVGHSYGAYTALFLAVKHPELVRTLVLAEAPAVSLLAHLPGDQAETGKATLAEIQQQMVSPMKQAFRKGDREAGIRAFMAFVSSDPQAWDKMSDAARKQTLRNAGEWDVMMTTGELFPDLDPREIRNIRAPVLLLSGEKSYPFLKLVDEELERLLPLGRRIILRGATHQMWVEQPEACRKAVLDFWHAASNHGPSGQTLAPFAAASGVTRADAASASRRDRIIPLRPMSGDVEILNGDPEKEGEPFVMRIRELPGTMVPLHSHPVDENITVVQGAWYFAVGDVWDRAALKELRPGDYAFAPKGSTMFGYCPDGAVVQIHGVGPFLIHWMHGVKTMDEPDAAATFTFRRGERVRGARGAGTIREGYASGDIIQYEIEKEDGSRFMASPEELHHL